MTSWPVKALSWPPRRETIFENSPIGILSVDLNIRCSRKWAMPETPLGSSAAPTLYQTMWVTTGARWSGMTATTSMPFDSLNSDVLRGCAWAVMVLGAMASVMAIRVQKRWRQAPMAVFIYLDRAGAKGRAGPETQLKDNVKACPSSRLPRLVLSNDIGSSSHWPGNHNEGLWRRRHAGEPSRSR